MGFLLDLGAFLTFEESKKVQEYIKKQGIIQFLKVYQKNRNIKQTNCSDFRWGDEIEYQVINIDSNIKKAKIQTNIDYLFKEIGNSKNLTFELHKEYGGWMVETIPAEPFNCWLTLNDLVKNFEIRRNKLSSILPEDNFLLSLSYPNLGVGDYYVKNDK